MRNRDVRIKEGTSCIRCRRQINFAMRFLMPDEFIRWNCQNCGHQYVVRAKTSEVPNVDMVVTIDNMDRGYEETQATFVLVDNKKWKMEATK